MKLYNEYAQWWHLLSSPEEYAEEAELYLKIIYKYRDRIDDALELGCGGGNNALHMKKHFRMTLTDISPYMLENSKRINPECEHIIGDMRDLRLGRRFGLVFIQDAIMHITGKSDLKKVFATAYEHLVEGGILFIAPDFFKETFRPSVSHGGHDDAQSGKGMRYLEWTFDDDKTDNIADTVLAYIFRDNGSVFTGHDHMSFGIFPQGEWEALLSEAGFRVYFETIGHSGLEPGSYIGIVGIR